MIRNPVGMLVRLADGVFQVRDVQGDTLKLRHGPDVKMTPDVILEEAPELPPLTGPTVPTTLNGALAQV
ncbi:MAG: hypothetical protein AAFY60_14880, partial [Myxococcota bacterium]